jgi:hypothetical protein
MPPKAKQDRPNLLAAMQALIGLKTNLLPSDEFDSEVKMDMAAISEWAGRLRKAREAAGLVYLFWVSDVIDRTEGK